MTQKHFARNALLIESANSSFCLQPIQKRERHLLV